MVVIDNPRDWIMRDVDTPHGIGWIRTIHVARETGKITVIVGFGNPPPNTLDFPEEREFSPDELTEIIDGTVLHRYLPSQNLVEHQ